MLKSLFGEDFYDVDFDGKNPYEEINEVMSQLVLTSRGVAHTLRIAMGQRATRDSKYLTEREKKILKRLIVFK